MNPRGSLNAFAGFLRLLDVLHSLLLRSCSLLELLDAPLCSFRTLCADLDTVCCLLNLLQRSLWVAT